MKHAKRRNYVYTQYVSHFTYLKCISGATSYLGCVINIGNCISVNLKSSILLKKKTIMLGIEKVELYKANFEHLLLC